MTYFPVSRMQCTMENWKDPDALREAIKSAGTADVSKETGIAYSTIHSFLTGETRSMRGDNLQKVILALTKLHKGEQAIDPMPDDFRVVPIYDIRASAGAGALVSDGDPTAYQPFREPEIARCNLQELAVIQVGGDSMWDTLHDGDKILVNRGERRIVKDGIYVIAFEGELLVKRCQRNLEDGSVLIISDNKAYQSFKVSLADQLDVIGRVIWIGRALG